MNNEVPEQSKTGVGRRAVVKGAAWAVPAVAVAAAAPAYAKSGVVENPCEETGDYYVALWSPKDNNVLEDRPNPTGETSSPNPTGGGTCISPDPECPPAPGFTRTTLTGIRLNNTGLNISHNTNFANQGPVTFSLQKDSCCVITKVKGHLHRYGAATRPDCPNPYCQEAGGDYLDVSGLNSQAVTVTPKAGTLCGNDVVHWGSPNRSSRGCTPSSANQQSNAFENGQPRGFLLLELKCTNPNEVTDPDD